MEHRYLAGNDTVKLWDEKILQSANYTEYTDWHLTELTRKRFLPRWPEVLQKMLKTMTGKDMMIYTQLGKDVSIPDLVALKEGKPVTPDIRKAWNKAGKKRSKNRKTESFGFG